MRSDSSAQMAEVPSETSDCSCYFGLLELEVWAQQGRRGREISTLLGRAMVPWAPAQRGLPPGGRPRERCSLAVLLLVVLLAPEPADARHARSLTQAAAGCELASFELGRLEFCLWGFESYTSRRSDLAASCGQPSLYASGFTYWHCFLRTACCRGSTHLLTPTAQASQLRNSQALTRGALELP